jgi:3-methylfumaryl-CoA hydratase
MTPDIQHLRKWIGNTEHHADILTARLAIGLRSTLDNSGGLTEEGDVVPSTIHWCLAPQIETMSNLGTDGHPARGGFLPPVPLPRRMWAAGELVFHDRFRVGDRVTRESRIEDVTSKKGRSGVLCFVTVRHSLSTERGLAIEERHDIVYREAASGSDMPPPAQHAQTAPNPQWKIQIAPDPVLLFRYSALTFNGHRIHYDRDYCRTVEGYPGLIVHGPLQATMLVEFATSIRDKTTPKRFSFRSVGPLFDGGIVTLNASETGQGSLDMWISDADGRKSMVAEAFW